MTPNEMRGLAYWLLFAAAICMLFLYWPVVLVSVIAAVALLVQAKRRANAAL